LEVFSARKEEEGRRRKEERERDAQRRVGSAGTESANCLSSSSLLVRSVMTLPLPAACEMALTAVTVVLPSEMVSSA